MLLPVDVQTDIDSTLTGQRAGGCLWTRDYETMVDAIGRAVRVEMARRAWEREDLASRVGISVDLLTRRLSGKREWKLRDFGAIAEALGLTASELMRRAEEIAAADAGAQATRDVVPDGVVVERLLVATKGTDREPVAA